MQISTESVKFYFYTEHVLRSDRESELNLSFDKKKDRLALGFFKVSCRLYAAIKTKCGYQICFLSIKFKRSLQLKVIKNVKRIRSLAKAERGFSFALFLNIRFASQSKV